MIWLYYLIVDTFISNSFDDIFFSEKFDSCKVFYSISQKEYFGKL